jgi:hypothetical protein
MIGERQVRAYGSVGVDRICPVARGNSTIVTMEFDRDVPKIGCDDDQVGQDAVALADTLRVLAKGNEPAAEPMVGKGSCVVLAGARTDSDPIVDGFVTVIDDAAATFKMEDPPAPRRCRFGDVTWIVPHWSDISFGDKGDRS